MGVGGLRGASDFAAAGLRLAREIEDRINMAQCLEALGWIDVARRDACRALILLGAPGGPVDHLGPAAAGLGEYHGAAVRAASELMPEPVAAAALARGAAMTPAEAVRFALGETAPSGAAPPTPAGAPPVLTRR